MLHVRGFVNVVKTWQKTTDEEWQNRSRANYDNKKKHSWIVYATAFFIISHIAI